MCDFCCIWTCCFKCRSLTASNGVKSLISRKWHFSLCKSWWCVFLNACSVELGVVWVAVRCCQPCHLNTSPNGNLSTRAAPLLTWHPCACSLTPFMYVCVYVCVQWGMGWRKKTHGEEQHSGNICIEMCLKQCIAVVESYAFVVVFISDVWPKISVWCEGFLSQ